MVRNSLNWCAVVLSFLDLGLAEFCPDTSTECRNISRSRDTSLCALQLIKDICATTCEVEGSCSTACSSFNYLGLFAFIFYGVGLFLLLIIVILSYSYFVDSRFSERVSFSVGKLKIPIEDSTAIKLADLKGSYLSIMSPLNPNNGLSKPLQSPSDDYVDIQRNRNDPDSKSTIFISEDIKVYHPPAVKQMSHHPACVMRYPDSVMRGSFRGDHEQEEADGAGYFDSNDDFFKNALIPENDSFHDVLELPAPCRVGAPRQSQALSKKMEKHKAAMLKRKKSLKLRVQDPKQEPKRKKRQSAAHLPRDQHSSSDRLSPRFLSTSRQSNKNENNNSEKRLTERLSNDIRANDRLQPLSDIPDESERTSVVRLSDKPKEDPHGGKRLLINKADSDKDGWYAQGHGQTRRPQGSNAPEGMESYAQPPKISKLEADEQDRLPKIRGLEVHNSDIGCGEFNRQGESDRGEPSPSLSIIKSDLDEKASDTARDDLICGKSRSSKTIQFPKERDTIKNVQVTPEGESPVKA